MRHGTGYSFDKGRFIQSSFCPTCCRRTIQQTMRGKYIQGTLFCCKKCKATYMEKLKKACEDRKIELGNIYIVDGISHVDEINSTVAHILASG